MATLFALVPAEFLIRKQEIPAEPLRIVNLSTAPIVEYCVFHRSNGFTLSPGKNTLNIRGTIIVRIITQEEFCCSESGHPNVWPIMNLDVQRSNSPHCLQ